MNLVNHANFLHLERSCSVGWKLIFILSLFALGISQGHSQTQQYTNDGCPIFHSDGSTAVNFTATGTATISIPSWSSYGASTFYNVANPPLPADYNPPGHTAGTPYIKAVVDNCSYGKNAAGQIQSYVGYTIYALGTPAPTVTGARDSSGRYLGNAPTPVAGPYLPSEFGGYNGNHDNGSVGPNATLMTGTVSLPVLPAGDYYIFWHYTFDIYAAPGTSEGSIGRDSAFAWAHRSIDQDVVINGGNPTPPPTGSNTPPTVYVSVTNAIATKGAGDFLKFTFQRVSPDNNYSQPLTVNFAVAGTAPSSDYTLNKTSPITFQAGHQTAQLRATPIENGVYDSGVTVIVTVRPDTASPTAYTRNKNPASGKILSPDRAPVCAFTTTGVIQPSVDNFALTTYVNQSVNIVAHAHDDDGDLAEIFIDSTNDDPPDGTNAFAYVAASGYDYDAGNPITFVTSGTYYFSVCSMDAMGIYSSTKHLTVTVANRPPVFTWGVTTVHVLAGGTVKLPYTITDSDSNLGVASGSGPNGYAVQASYPDSGSGTGSFAFSAPTAGTYTITGTATDKEGLVSVVSPAITVIVEPINHAPTATFVSPAPGGANSSVTHFVDDVLSIGATAADGDNNLASLQISLDGAAWAQAPAPAGSVSSLAASGTFTVPVLGAETSHTYTFGSVATDSGTIPGGQIVQTPQSSSTAVLTVVVPNRAPSISWTVPAGGIGQTADNPFMGYLLQPLRITAHAVDRDGNLSFENIRLESTDKGGGSNVKGRSADGRTGDVSFNFTPTKPGLYTFTGLAGDSAGSSADPISLYVLVQDYPSEGTGTIGALIVSPSNSIAHVFEPLGPPIVVKGGVAALGRDGRPKIIQNAIGVGASQIIPAPNYLNGTQIPPLTPPILDLRTVTVAPSVDHEDASAGHN